MGKMLLSGLDLSRWCEYHLMQWSLSRQMTSNRARYLNQDLIVLVRCRKPVIFRVGICVGIGWCCLLLTILNHEVKSHVRVRPSHHTVCKSSRSRAVFFVSEITHIRAVYRPARKAVQYSSFCSRWSQVCSGWKLHRPHYVGRVVSLCYLNVLTMWLR